MNKYLIFLIFFYGCSKELQPSFSLDTVTIIPFIDPLNPKVQLQGFFEPHSSHHAQYLSCELIGPTESKVFDGALLAGGQIFVIFDVENFYAFIHQFEEITIIINQFQGKLKGKSKNYEKTFFKYLPSTIVYDLS
jgi:hypothetical protein